MFFFWPGQLILWFFWRPKTELKIANEISSIFISFICFFIHFSHSLAVLFLQCLPCLKLQLIFASLALRLFGFKNCPLRLCFGPDADLPSLYAHCLANSKNKLRKNITCVCVSLHLHLIYACFFSRNSYTFFFVVNNLFNASYLVGRHTPRVHFDRPSSPSPHLQTSTFFSPFMYQWIASLFFLSSTVDV